MSCQAKSIWAVPVLRLGGEISQASPQQARLASLSKTFTGDWSPQLRASIAGEVDEDRLLRAVLHTINTNPALRSYLSADSPEVIGPTSLLGLADVVRGPCTQEGALITLRRDESELRYELLIRLHPGSVDSCGLMRALEEMIRRYRDGDTDAAATMIKPQDVAKHLSNLLQDGHEGICFWHSQMAQQAPTLLSTGGLRLIDAVERDMKWVHVARVNASQLPFDDAVRQRAALVCLWQMLLSRVAFREPGFGLYCEGACSEFPGLIGLLGRYVPSGPAILAGERMSLVNDTVRRVRDLDVLADFFPCQALSGRLHRIGLRFNHSELKLQFGQSSIRIDDLTAPLEPFDLELIALSSNHRIQVSLHYNANALDAVSVRSIARGVSCLLKGLTEQPRGFIDLDNLLPAEEMSVLRGKKREFLAPVEDVFSIFERHARLTPNRRAAADQQTTLSYGELLQVAEQIDRSLAELGVAPGDGVAICMKRRPPLIATLLGVMRRGAFFVPLDASHPLSRIQTILCEVAPKLILCDPEILPILKSKVEPPLFCIEDLSVQDGVAPLTRPHARSNSDIAYLLYTSGSTGVPKGVEVSHGALMNYLNWAVQQYEIERGSGAVVFSSIAFDMVVTSLFVPLVGGRTVHLIADDDFESLTRFLDQTETLSFLKLTPSALSLLGELMSAEKIARATRHIVLGGERVQANSLRCISVADDQLITNEYGPTETTVGSVAYTFKPSDAVSDPIPIGTPLWNTAIAIINPPDRIAMKGMTGEIAIGGAGVAIGYRNRAKETAERFRSLPAVGDGAWYFTGDLGFLRDDGQLVYQGRIDQQVKIHGYRVETGEVASILARCPEVASVAVVVARLAATGKAFLSAFIKPRSEISRLEIARVYAWAEAHLPSYARPDRVELLDEFPLARSGKIDHEALIARSAVPVASAAMQSRNLAGYETVLSSIWQQILGRPLLQPHDSFFAMGGDSIKALHFVVAAREKGIHLAIADILNGRSFDRIVKSASAMYPSQPRASRTEGEIPLLPIQRAYFDLNCMNQDQWFLYWIFPADGAIEQTRLATAATVVRNRHPALRSTFCFESSRWKCDVKTCVEAEPLEVIHITESDDGKISKELIRQLAVAGQSLRLEQGVVVKLCCFDLGPSRGLYLAWVANHLVVDIVSLQIIARELLSVYHQASADHLVNDDDGYVRWTRDRHHGEQFQFPRSALAGLCEQLVETHAKEVGDRITAPDVAGHRRAVTLILTALMRSLAKVEGLSEVLEICVERQGRGRDKPGIELLNAVGWLTDYKIVALPGPQVTSTADLIEQLHPLLMSNVMQTPRGVLPEIALNFLGEMNVQQKRFLPPQLSIVQGEIDVASLLFPLEIVVWIDEGRLLSSWRFEGTRYSRAQIRQLMSHFQLELLDVLSANEHVEPLPSDYPEASLSKADLTRIFADYQKAPTQ